jgi:hypothetical protein
MLEPPATLGNRFDRRRGARLEGDRPGQNEAAAAKATSRAGGRGLQYPREPLSFFCDSSLDGGGDLYDQGHLCGRAEAQSGAHLVSKHYFRRFYRLGGTVGSGLHEAPFVDQQRRETTLAS